MKWFRMLRSGRTPEAVRVQLQQILASPAFTVAPRLSDFLRFIVEETIEGRGGELKEYVVGTRVYHRPASYDPRLDATVRVEAHKLRLRLAQYYGGPGRSDRVVISIPKGSYAAHFETRRRQLPRRFSWIIASSTATLLCIAALFVAVSLYIRARPAPLTRPLTTYPGGEYEPAFSPDGKRIAFVWNGKTEANFDIYVRPIDVDDVLKLTNDKAPHGSPAWSPDGNRIAFLRYGESPNLCGVYTISALGSGERKVASVSPIREIYDRHVHWSPSGDTIAYVDRPSPEEPFAIYTVTAFGENRRRVTVPPQNFKGDTGPVFSPDGRWIAFRRTTSASVNDIYIVPSIGGQARRLTFDNRFTSAHAWLPGGDEIVFSSNRSGALELWRVKSAGGAPHPVPNLGQGANFLSVARNGSMLAYSRWFADSNVWKYPISGKGPQAPVRLIASTRSDLSPQYSPDGSKIAFRSERSGGNEIWICDADGSNTRRLTSSNGVLTGSPRWSPDGRWIAFDSRPQGFSQIFVISAAGGNTRRVTTGDRDNVVPSWSADGRSIYFSANASGRSQIWKTPWDANDGQDHSVQVTKNGGFVSFESADGRSLYYSKGPDRSGLFRMPVAGGPEESVVDTLRSGLWGNWALTRDALYWVDLQEDRRAYLFSKRLDSVRVLRILPLDRPPYANDSGLSVSQDGESLLYGQVDHSGSEIMLIEHFR